ncbi:calpain-A-like [Condylostylus longicornis]|uniref:calpain-A-like n=1 Tax=Condylostylus longicornis TaxID=2530218 RepID=UPI00244DE6B9|nr:calpain-A-like [Condylostylus longicornis]
MEWFTRIRNFFCSVEKRINELRCKITKCFRLFGKKSSHKEDEHDDYNKILEKVTKKGKLFKDKQFPATEKSLKHSGDVDAKIKWLRPHEICDDPEFIVDGHDRFDCKQGELGDCWLLAAVANLTLHEDLFRKVVPSDQSFKNNYAGVFRFSFWRFGKWVDIVVDDRLPTKNGHLIYMHSSNKNEFWSALLEKAFAKLHDSYENLRGGSACEAMQDFTGGITEWYDLRDNANMMAHFKIMLKAYEKKSMMCCSIIVDDDSQLESETEDGLIRGHAYSITKVALIDIQTPNKTGKIPMIRLRNPWGNDVEWHGQWSDQSPEWQFIPENVKKEIGLNFDHDGEFWMSLQDFYHNFDLLDICHLTPDWLIEEPNDGDDDEDDVDRFIWETSLAEGKWIQNVTAGGCRNFLKTFWRNPQFKVTLVDPDDEDDDDTCSVLIALMQKNRRAQKHLGVQFLTIGFSIYSLDEADLAFRKQPLEFFKYKASICRSSFVNLREVTGRFKLLPGDYLIVPSTYDPNEEAEFLIRVYTEKKNIMNKC